MSIISDVLLLFGISSAPVTVQDFLWDLLVIVVGLYVIKYVWLFASDLFGEIMRMR